MAATIYRTANPAGVNGASNVATYADQPIGNAAPNRTVVVLVSSELASTPIDSVTLGGSTMTAGTQGNEGAVYARAFYLAYPTGTTATVAVTFGTNTPNSTQNHIAVYSVYGGTYSSGGADSSTDMDATDPLTTGSTTIASGGVMIAVAGGATDGTGKTWANLTEDIDDDAGGFRFCTAMSATAGTATRTCTGGTNGEDGALSWLIFADNASPSVALNSPADASSDSDTTPLLDFTGTDGESDSVRFQTQIKTSAFVDTTILSSSSNSSAGSSTATTTVPAGAASGHKMVVIVHANTQTTIVDNNGGDPFTVEPAFDEYQPNTSSGHTVSVFTKTLTGSDSADYSFTLGASVRWSIVAFCVSNPHGTLFNIAPNTANAYAIDSPPSVVNVFDAPSITTTVRNCIHVSVVCGDTATLSIDTIPQGYTTIQNTSNQPMGVAYKHIPLAEATGATKWRLQDVNMAAIAFSFAIQPVQSTTLDKISGTDTGYANPDTGGDTDPFNSGENIQYTVQGGDALAANTYYWRVRGVDPSGSNTYGSWTAARTFTITSGSSSIKTVKGLALASVKTVNGLAIASVKTINGLA